MKNLSVLVPFYNEEATLELSINRLIDCNIAEKIILINDCSTDNSLEIANNLVKLGHMLVEGLDPFSFDLKMP